MCQPLLSLQQEAQAAWHIQTCFLELRAPFFRMQEIPLRNHARKRLHTLILKQTGSCYGLFGQRDIRFMRVLLWAAFSLNKCKLSTC